MFDELYNSVKVRFGSGSSTMSMGDWICSNTTIKNKPFSFDGYEFQKTITDDMHPDMSVIKCSQIGMTEVQIRKFLAMLTRGNAVNGIFTLPNERMFTKTYNGRVKPILDKEEIFNPPTDGSPTRRKDQFQIRDSFGYMTGCTEGEATSTTADFLFHDEVDLSPQTILSLYQSRLQNSDMKITQKFSTPTFENFGIDKDYKISDQHEYAIRCEACNHWQIPDFEPRFLRLNLPMDIQDFSELTEHQIAELDLEDAHLSCEQCGRRLNMYDPSLREWIARFPSRTNNRGYWIRPFSTVRLKPRYVFTQLGKYKKDGFLRGFYNTVLGKPYSDKNSKIQRADIEACMQSPNIQDVGNTPCYLGVDIGFQCHITLSIDGPDGIPVFILFEHVPIGGLEMRIADLRKIYNIVQGASDRFPYTSEVDALRDATGGCVMPVQYRGTSVLAPVKDELGFITHYSANRTYMLDRIQTFINYRKMVLSGYGGQRETLIAHISDMNRDDRPGDKVDVEAVWIKGTGNDHYFHSMALSLISRRICEHMYHNQDAPPAQTPDLLGASWMSTGSSLLSSGAKKISRLGMAI